MNGHVPGLPDDVVFTRALLDLVATRTCVDPARVYATGVSNGGGLAARLGCALADRLAAVAPVAGGYSSLPACRPAGGSGPASCAAPGAAARAARPWSTSACSGSATAGSDRACRRRRCRPPR